MEERFIVTGADGFVGREICAQLLRQGCYVRGLLGPDRKTSVPLPSGLVTLCGDVLDRASLEPLFSGMDGCIVIHTAAVISVQRHDRYCERVNTKGVANLVDACRAHNVKKLVHFGSVDALHPPEDGSACAEPVRFSSSGLPTSYGRSKAEGANLVLDSGLDCAVVLPACIVGPGDYRGGFVSRSMKTYLRGMPPVSIEGGYNFVDVRDVASAAISASLEPTATGCFILSGAYENMTKVYDLLATLVHRRSTVYTMPLWTLYGAAPIMTGISRIKGEQPVLTIEAINLMASSANFSNARAKEILGFSPRKVSQSILDEGRFLKNINY